MFGVGTAEIALILVVALLIFGPKKLPELARSLAKTIHAFKSTANDAKAALDKEIKDLETASKPRDTKKESAQTRAAS